MDGDSAGRLISLVLLLVAVGGWVMVEYRELFNRTCLDFLAEGRK